MSSDHEERMNPLFHFPFGSYLILRLEYILLTEGEELEAKILRLIEKRMEDKRRHLFQKLLNATTGRKIQPDQVLDITKDVWVPISHPLFLYDLYGVVKSENTLKRAIKSLGAKKLILTRQVKNKYRYAPTEYKLNIALIEAEFQKMGQAGKTGYQFLIPSTTPGGQFLIPSEGQKMLPSKSPVSSNRVSGIDPHSRSNYCKDITEEEGEVTTPNTPNSQRASAAAVEFSVESLTQEEIDLIQAYRQRSLNATLSENLGGAADATNESEQAECASKTIVPPLVPDVPEEEQALLTRPRAVTTAEEVMQMWEQVRGVRYEKRERVVQLRAATMLLGRELPNPLTPELLETLYTTYYDDFWKKKYGELHLTHLVEVEKSSGQVRVTRWIKRLGFQSLPIRSSERPVQTTIGQQESFKPTMDFANYHQEEERDLVQDYAEGKMSAKELASYTPRMIEIFERHAAARRAENGGQL